MSGKPSIIGISAKAQVLQRRLEHLQRQVEHKNYGDRSVTYFMAEIYALMAAIQVLEWYGSDRNNVEGLSPFSVIERFASLDLDSEDDDDKLYELQRMAKEIVQKVAQC